ncbi:ABC transporter permease [Actinoplanes sp. NPDC051470]|uniref:ABC transporter permease n=1 Tax=unclassified Actinoplanes TaxID=2626549 RepID=UPI00342EB760
MTDTRRVRLSPLDLLALGLIGIRTRRGRAALSAIGIAIGIATMIVVIGIPASSQASLVRELSALGTNVLEVRTPPDADPPVAFPPTALGMVERIGPILRSGAVGNTHAVVRRSDQAGAAGSGLAVLASSLDLPESVNARIARGRWLAPPASAFPTAVLGAVAATRLGINRIDGSPGPLILIGNTWFTVIGILAPIPLSAELDRSVLVGWEAARDWLGFDGRPTVVYVQSQEDAIESVRAVLPATVYPQSPGKAIVTRPSEALAAKRLTQTAFAALFLGLAGIALLVGGIGVANTMVISVLERRSEIGLRRALGANRGQIRGQFLTESVVLSVLGGAAGTALGLLTTFGYATYQGWPVVIPGAAVLAGLGGAVLIGMVAGVYPSVRASRLTPTQALAAN